jgi:geranylgeranyl pyrophosphate synthase
MIYTACLIHKGVVNLSDFSPTDSIMEDMESGNKMATLTGDFLLANACTELASLNNTQVDHDSVNKLSNFSCQRIVKLVTLFLF